MIIAIAFVGTQSEGSLTIEPGGVPGPTGPKPEHGWSGTQLRFKLPNGSWGSYVDLRGPAPEHQWTGTSLRFREPGGAWGDSANLKGAAGTLEIGTVGAVPFGEEPSVENVGTASAAILNIDLPAGPGVELSVSATHIQCRLQGETEWNDLVPLSSILGYRGWSPIMAVVADGARRVLQVVGWTGGEGDEPESGLYVGEEGYVEDVGDAVDVRGPDGPPGAGNMTGPGSATAGHLAVFGDTSGQLLADGGAPFSGAYDDLTSKPPLGDASGLDVASAAEMRAAGAKVVTAERVKDACVIVTLPYAATIAVNWAAFVVADVTLTGNPTLGNPTNVQPGTTRYILVKGNNATERTLSFASYYKGNLPSQTVSSTKWLLVALTAYTATHIVVTAARAL